MYMQTKNTSDYSPLQDINRDGVYCAFHKHANSKIQKPPSQLRFSMPSNIITITSNEPWNTETHKTGRNPPITDHKPWPFEPVKATFCFLRGPLRWLTAAKNANVSWFLNFRVCVFMKSAVSSTYRETANVRFKLRISSFSSFWFLELFDNCVLFSFHYSRIRPVTVLFLVTIVFDELRPNVSCIHSKLIIACRVYCGSKNSKNVLFRSIMISFEKSVSNWKFPV